MTITLLMLGLGVLAIAALRPTLHAETTGNSDDPAVVEAIDALLPQTQCGRCGYPGCRPYAQAIVRGEIDIDHCPPGGDQTARALAELLGREPLPVANDLRNDGINRVAVIDEDVCIGCVKCIRACPVDAIIGAPKHLHTVIAADCTGCGLCLPPCPVDCIELVPQRIRTREWVWPRPGAEAGS